MCATTSMRAHTSRWRKMRPASGTRVSPSTCPTLSSPVEGVPFTQPSQCALAPQEEVLVSARDKAPCHHEPSSPATCAARSAWQDGPAA